MGTELVRGSLYELEDMVRGIPGGVCGDGGSVTGGDGDQGGELGGIQAGVASGDDEVAGARAGVTGGDDEDAGGGGILAAEFGFTSRIFWL